MDGEQEQGLNDSDSGIDDGIQIINGPITLTQQMAAVPVNELCKWTGISYIDHEYLENIKLAYIFQEVTALVTTSDEFYLVGRNVHGSLGTAVTVSYTTKVPVRIDSLCGRRIKDFAFSIPPETEQGVMSLFALTEDGYVFSWGYNAQGQLGQKQSSKGPLAPRKVEGLPAIKQIASGGGHTLTLSYDGEVWSWGRNLHGQVGKGTMQDHHFAVNISNHFPDKVREISCGKNHSVALTVKGHVYTWGFNKKGQLGLPKEQLDGAHHDIAITPKRLTFNNNENIKIKKISSGKNHCLALTSNGDVFAWGHGKYGQIGHKSRENARMPTLVTGFEEKVIDISCVSHLNVSTCYCADASRDTQATYMWGQLPESNIVEPWETTFMRTISDIYASYFWPPTTPKPISRNNIVPDMTLSFHYELMKWSAIKAVKPDFLPRVKIAFVCGAGYEQTVCLVTFTDEFYFVGKSVTGSLGSGVSDEFATRTPVRNQILSGKRVSDFVFGLDVDGGAMCLFALTEVGTVYSWGYNEFAELGLGFETHGSQAVGPTKIQGALKNVKVTRISGGADHYFALSESGELFGWGYNYFGQVGGRLPSKKKGQDTFVLSPVNIKFPKGVKIKQATGGNMHSVAVTTEGKVYAWGRNDDHRLQMGTPSTEVWCETPTLVKFPTSPSTKIDKVCCGPDCTLALSKNCDLFFWGECKSSGEKFPVPVQICQGLDPICDIGTAQWSSIYAVQTTTNKVFVWGNVKGESDPVLKPKEEFRATSISDAFAILSMPPCMLKPLRITKR